MHPGIDPYPSLARSCERWWPDFVTFTACKRSRFGLKQGKRRNVFQTGTKIYFKCLWTEILAPFLKSMLHWFIIFEFKLWSGMQNSFSIPPKLAKNAVVVFWGLELKWRHKVCKVRLLHFEPVYFLQSWHSLSRLFGGFIQWKMSSNDELSSDTSSSCDAESLQLAVEGKGSFNSIIQH